MDLFFLFDQSSLIYSTHTPTRIIAYSKKEGPTRPTEELTEIEPPSDQTGVLHTRLDLEEAT